MRTMREKENVPPPNGLARGNPAACKSPLHCMERGLRGEVEFANGIH